MFKNINKGDSSVKRIEVFADNSLLGNSTGVSNKTGLSGSLNYISASNWLWAYSTFYNTETILNSYKSHFYQTKNLNTTCSIISVSPANFGHKIKPGTFYLETAGVVLRDDASGNLYDTDSGSSYVKGNVFYGHGISVLTDESPQYQNFSDASVIKFKGSQYIYEHTYICRVSAGEMNSTTNPSYVYGKDSSSTHPGNEVRNVNCPAFITTIGLYDNENRLMAVGKFAKPIYKTAVMDMSLIVKFDL